MAFPESEIKSAIDPNSGFCDESKVKKAMRDFESIEDGKDQEVIYKFALDITNILHDHGRLDLFHPYVTEAMSIQDDKH